MRSYACPLFALVFGFVGCSASQQAARNIAAVAADHADASIAAGDLAPVIRFLSDDLLEGRGPGTRGDRIARQYIATQMELLGLQPGMPDGSWEQTVPLVGITSTSPEAWSFRHRERSVQLRRHRDFVALSPRARGAVAVRDAELVFVGYGIEAREFEWDDFKGADLRGKILLMLNNDPDWDEALFAGKRRLYYGRWTYKYESAARQGAAGAIVIHTTESAGYPWQTVQTSWGGENSRLPGGDQPVKLEGWVTEEAAARLVALGGHDWAQLVAAARERDFRPVALGVKTSIELRNQVREYRSANVVGLLPGRDPELRRQAIVYTAHHDHLGIGRDPDGNEVIYNGALDNAAGIAQLLAIAGAFSAPPEPPLRSTLFVAAAAEEQGLLGSEYFAAHPPVPARDLVANINIDGGNIWGRTRDIAVVGFGKSTIDRWAEEAARQQGRVLVDERFPDRGMFYRSDQFNFAKIGVPVLYAKSGIDYIGRPPEWGRTETDAWVQRHYHQPSDDFDESWNLDGMVEDTRFLFAVGHALAASGVTPEWHAGDEFEALR